MTLFYIVLVLMKIRTVCKISIMLQKEFCFVAFSFRRFLSKVINSREIESGNKNFMKLTFKILLFRFYVISSTGLISHKYSL